MLAEQESWRVQEMSSNISLVVGRDKVTDIQFNFTPKREQADHQKGKWMTTPTLPSSDTSFDAFNESKIGEIDLEEDQYINSLPHSVFWIREKLLLEWTN